MRNFFLLFLILIVTGACKKSETDPDTTPAVVKDPADYYVKNYTITEHMVQTYGGPNVHDETFTCSAIKVDANTIKFVDKRPVVPIYSLNGIKIGVRKDSIVYGSVTGKRYGNDSLVIVYDFAAGMNGYHVKWRCK